MRIFTSSWFVQLPPTIQKIGISRGTPRGYDPGYRKIKALAPGAWFQSVSPEEYHRRFMEQLAALDARQIVARIELLAAGKDAALLCYEKPGDASAWCHRAQVSLWLHEKLGLEVFEYGMEGAGCGIHHPKLSAAARQGGLL